MITVVGIFFINCTLLENILCVRGTVLFLFMSISCYELRIYKGNNKCNLRQVQYFDLIQYCQKPKSYFHIQRTIFRVFQTNIFIDPFGQPNSLTIKFFEIITRNFYYFFSFLFLKNFDHICGKLETKNGYYITQLVGRYSWTKNEYNNIFCTIICTCLHSMFPC